MGQIYIGLFSWRFLISSFCALDKAVFRGCFISSLIFIIIFFNWDSYIATL